jgi:tRNA(fMet)-specific endonuclease VapC
MHYLLDTSICVFFLRGKLSLLEEIRKRGVKNFSVSEVTVFELRYGAEKSLNPTVSHSKVDDFLNGLRIIPIYGCAKLYAVEKARLERQGTPLHDEFDLLIGVTAIEHDLILVTDNVKHFTLLNGLEMENWLVR